MSEMAAEESHDEIERVSQNQSQDTEQLELIYGARHVILLFVPVTICMAVVVVTINSVQYYTKADGYYMVYTPFHPKEDDSNKDIIVKSTLNTLIVLAVVIVMTFVLIFLYKFRCYKCMHLWIILSSVMLLFIVAFVYLQELLKAFNMAADIISVVLILYNFGITGMWMIHSQGPLILQQAYLIISASLMSLIFIKYLPEWTLWFLLGALAVWATARYVILTSSQSPSRTNNASQEERSADQADEQSRKLSSTEVELKEGQRIERVEESTSRVGPESQLRHQEEREENEERAGEDRGVKLGLGDFIFYSVLVGKASSGGDAATTIACFIAILMGLFLTLTILVTVKKALPALPISIIFGLIFNFGTFYAIGPMMTQFAANQIFV